MAFSGPAVDSSCHCWHCPAECECSCYSCRAREQPEPEMSGADAAFMHAVFACFQCHRVTKKKYRGSEAGIWGDLLMSHGGANVDPQDGGGPGLDATYNEPCHQCKRQMYCVGPGFKTPAEKDDREWRRQELLAWAGYCSSPCDCYRAGNREALARLQVAAPDEVDPRRLPAPPPPPLSNRAKK